MLLFTFKVNCQFFFQSMESSRPKSREGLCWDYKKAKQTLCFQCWTNEPRQTNMESQQTVFGLSRDNASPVSYIWVYSREQSCRSWGLYRKSVKKNVEGIRSMIFESILRQKLVLTDSLSIVVLRCRVENIENSKSD